MKTKWKYSLAVVAVLALFKMVGCGTAKEAYQNHCASCHANNLEGGFGPNMQKIGSKYSKEEIANIIENGIGTMPAQKQVSDEERENLSAWLAEQK